MNQKEVTFSNLEKIFFPELGITKGQLIKYYLEIAPYISPHLKDRPQSLKRYPNGIHNNFFYQKNFPDVPYWIDKVQIKNEETINYLLCQNKLALAYIINLGCIDLNPWLSRVGNLENPDFAVLDLDPLGNPFSEVIEVAKVTKKICDQLNLKVFPKTSGATGLHIYFPFNAVYTYEQARNFLIILSNLIHREIPQITSTERSPSKRKNKVYIDCLQNYAGQTIASAYSVRPNAFASVSTPLLWEELNSNLDPKNFNIFNTFKRLKKYGDIFSPVLYENNDIKKALKILSS